MAGGVHPHDCEVATVKASFFMFFDYLAMMGVPVLLVLLAISTIVLPGHGTGVIWRTIILFLMAVGALVYGLVGVREAYIHGKRKN